MVISELTNERKNDGNQGMVILGTVNDWDKVVLGSRGKVVFSTCSREEWCEFGMRYRFTCNQKVGNGHNDDVQRKSVVTIESEVIQKGKKISM